MDSLILFVFQSVVVDICGSLAVLHLDLLPVNERGLLEELRYFVMVEKEILLAALML